MALGQIFSIVSNYEFYVGLILNIQPLWYCCLFAFIFSNFVFQEFGALNFMIHAYLNFAEITHYFFKEEYTQLRYPNGVSFLRGLKFADRRKQNFYCVGIERNNCWNLFK